MLPHKELEPQILRALIRKGEIQWAGNRRLKIYGRLSCSSGKRMKPENRVFFASQEEAIEKGFRPCGHCMKEAYVDYQRSRLSST